MCTQLWLVLAVMKGQLSPVWFLSSPNRCRAELTAATPTPHMGRMGSTATNWIICLSPIFVKRPICRNQRGFVLPVGVRAQLLPEIQSAGFYIYLFFNENSSWLRNLLISQWGNLNINQQLSGGTILSMMRMMMMSLLGQYCHLKLKSWNKFNWFVSTIPSIFC